MHIYIGYYTLSIALTLGLFFTTPVKKIIATTQETKTENIATTTKKQKKTISAAPEEKQTKKRNYIVWITYGVGTVIAGCVTGVLIYFSFIRWRKNHKKVPIVGLPNLWLTCYMNPPIQILWMMTYSLGEPTLAMIRSWSNLKPNSPEEEVAIAFSQVIKAIEETKSTLARPKALPKKYLANLLSKMGAIYRQYNTPKNKNNSECFLKNLLKTINKALRRQTSKEEKKYTDHDLKKGSDLSSSLPEAYDKIFTATVKKSFLNYKASVEKSQLSEFEKLYTSYHLTPKVTSGKKGYEFKHQSYQEISITSGQINNLRDLLKSQCMNREEEYTPKKKKPIMIILPTILFVEVDGVSGIRNKTKLEYPLSDLLLGDKDDIYDLIGLTVHLDAWREVPHYITLTKDTYQNQWYESNDSHVRPVTPEYVADHTKQTAYFESAAKPTFFIYKKRNALQEEVEGIHNKKLVQQA